MKLTKSEYLIYLDAPRHLWAYTHGKLDQKELDTFTKHLFEQGYEVQKYAKKYVLETLIPQEYNSTTQYRFEETKTDRYIESGDNKTRDIESAEFEIRIDLIIYNPTTNKHDIYEIKSTKEVKPIHKKDLTFQYLVLKKHYEVGRCYILHLNNQYVREGALDISQLFTRTEITDEVEKLSEVVHQERYDALGLINTPDYNQTEACIKPKKCPCRKLCHPDLPEYSIYEITRLTANKDKIHNLELNYSKNILDVPTDAVLGKKYSLTANQRKQVTVAQLGVPIVETADIMLELQKLEYPLYFIDYESFNPAVPMYEKYKPYDQMPFQYSLHIQNSPNAEYIHREFIETNPVDPSLGFLDALRGDIGEKGSVIIWSKFERTQNEAMKRRYLQYASLLENVNSRLWDLMDIFQKLKYVHPNFKGSYSIKKVLPVLVPELSYKGMAIADGSMAMTKWVQMVYGGGITALDFSESEECFGDPTDIPRVVVDVEETKENLLRYCELDTWAMVRILERVRGEMGI